MPYDIRWKQRFDNFNRAFHRHFSHAGFFGLPDKTLATIRHILAECTAVEKAILYGSRAKGNYRLGSDIDLALIGDRLDLNTLGDPAARMVLPINHFRSASVVALSAGRQKIQN